MDDDGDGPALLDAEAVLVTVTLPLAVPDAVGARDTDDDAVLLEDGVDEGVAVVLPDADTEAVGVGVGVGMLVEVADRDGDGDGVPVEDDDWVGDPEGEEGGVDGDAVPQSAPVHPGRQVQVEGDAQEAVPTAEQEAAHDTQVVSATAVQADCWNDVVLQVEHGMHENGCPAHVALLYWPGRHDGGGQAAQVRLPRYRDCVQLVAATW